MHHNKPKISVIMTFYNCEAFLTDAIESILYQSFRDLELIIINDASSDMSEEIIKHYLNIDKRIIYIKNDINRWKTYNSNLGIDRSSGEYIAIMDGDDISLLDRLEKQLDFLLKNNQVDVVWTQQVLIDINNNIIWELLKPVESYDIRKNTLLFQTMNHPTMLIKKEVLNRFRYREAFSEFDDNDLFMRMFLSGVVWYNLPKKLYKYRIHNNNVNSKLLRKNALKYFQCQRNVIKLYNYTVSFKEMFFIYWYLITWLLLNSSQQRILQKYIKDILYPTKKLI